MNNNEILVSIRCATFNHESYIRDCLEGFIMQQTTFRFEAIVHDDASTDNTAEIIREYAQKYPEIIKPIYETNNQYSKHDGSLNRILDAEMRGKYIAICEGDDYWTDPYKLQKQVDILESDSSLMAVVTNSCIVDNHGSVIAEQQDNIVPGNITGRYDIRSFFYNIHQYPTGTVCYRNVHKEEISKNREHTRNDYLGDWTLWICLHIFGDFYYQNEVTSAYRINPTSVTHTCDRIGRAKANWTICKAVQDILPEEYNDIRNSLNNLNWAYEDLILAYKHESKYLNMLWNLLIYMLKEPKAWFRFITKRK